MNINNPIDEFQVLIKSPSFELENVDPGELNTSTEDAGKLMGLSALRSDSRFKNITGEGYAVAVLDTGIDIDHPAFGVDKNKDGISDRIIYQEDFADKDKNSSDVNNHGSNVSSIIASENSSYLGVAPDSDIVSLKVFRNDGTGSFRYVEDALHWVLDNHEAHNIKVVNMSLSDTGNYDIYQRSYGIGEELEALTKLGITLVAASGNEFYSYGSRQGVGYPAAHKDVISVGAVYDSGIKGYSYGGGAKSDKSAPDVIAPFSQRHSTLTDIFAPGAPIMGANKNGGAVIMHGTSQASPQVAGVALLAQQIAQENLGRELTPLEIKTLLKDTGKVINDGDDEDDNVTNTGLDFKRLDAFALAKGILTLDPDTAIDYSVTTANNSYIEGNSSVRTISVKITRDYTIESSSINFNFNSSTASEGSDFSLSGVYGNGVTSSVSKITFAPGADTAYINLGIKGDTISEPDEIIKINFTNGTPSIKGSSVDFSVNSPLDIKILNDDGGKPNIPKAIGEIGKTNVNSNWTTIELDNTYNNPIVVTALGFNGVDAGATRIRNIDSDSFEIRISEPSTYSVGHLPEPVSYMVVEAGKHQLVDGSYLQAGIVSTNAIANREMKAVGLQGFTSTPTLLTQVQSNNDSDWVVTRAKDLTKTGFKVAMQEEELFRVSNHATEDIGFIALQDKSNDFLTGNFSTNKYKEISSTKDVLFAEDISLNGMDAITIRVEELANAFGITMQEETSLDTETSHMNEAFNFLSADFGNIMAVA